MYPVAAGLSKNGLLTVSQKQFKEGIDAVIVDNVLAIRKGLTNHESGTPSEESEASAV